MNNCLIIIFPTQLFEKKYLENIFNYNEDNNEEGINKKNVKNNINKYVILWEHDYFFTRYKYHKLKLAFHRSSMQKYYDDLDKNYKKLYINNIDKNPDNLIQNFIKKNNINSIRFFNPIEKQLFNLIEHKKIIKNSALDIEHLIFPSPYFLNSSSFKINDNIQKELNGTIRHDVFYKKQRIMYDVMVKNNKNNKNNKHEPEGGKWSFDTENRKPYEKDHKDPGILILKNKTRLEYIREAIKYVNTNYKNHYGTCEEEDFIYPIDHEESIKWLDNFIKDKLENFGKYEDALSTKIKFGYHSMLSALNNVGLITSQDILDKVKNYKKNIASKEGFIRQVIGWREYCYFIYDKYNDNMISKLFYNKNNNKLPKKFWEGETNMPFIDHIIKNVNKYAYSHHIERLMCLGVYLLFIGVSVEEIYIWFQTMYIDAYDVFMVPNVYGMLCYGFVDETHHMMTKPYFSGSNYILKMSDYKLLEKKEIEINNKKYKWDEIYDGLYYNYINNYSDKLEKIYSSALAVKRWKTKMSEDVKKEHLKLANMYIKWING